MSGHDTGGAFPTSLRGYKLKKIHHGPKRLILWIIIILVLLWFFKRDLLFSLFEFLKNLMEKSVK